jgi:hypothetical protein
LGALGWCRGIGTPTPGSRPAGVEAGSGGTTLAWAEEGRAEATHQGVREWDPSAGRSGRREAVCVLRCAVNGPERNNRGGRWLWAVWSSDGRVRVNNS